MNEATMTNWYLLGIGSEVDIHTIHYHAESFLFKVSTRNMLWGKLFELKGSMYVHCEKRWLVRFILEDGTEQCDYTFPLVGIC